MKKTHREYYISEKDKGKKKHKKRLIIEIIILAGLLIILLLTMRGCSKDVVKLNLDMPEFEDSVDRGRSRKVKATTEGVNLAVVPDFTVTKKSQSFVIPYPENVYDVEFDFVDKESGEERYRTNRIRPETVVSIPAYSFCEKGTHAYRIEVKVFDGESYEEVPSAVALEMNITKK